MNNKKTYLLGVSIITLSSVLSVSTANAQCTGQQVRSYYCEDYNGNTVADSFCDPDTYPGLSASAVAALGPNKPANETITCNSAPCPPPPPPPYSSSGGDGGDGGGYSDTNGDNQGDTKSADGGPHGSTDSTEGGSPPGGGSGGDGGGGSVLCGHFFERNILTPEIYAGDLAFAQDHVSNAAKRGYRLWAVPLTKHLNANPDGVIEKMAQPFVVSWAQEMAHRSGHTNQGHWLGKLQLKMVKPIVGFIGLFVNDTSWSHLESEKSIYRK